MMIGGILSGCGLVAASFCNTVEGLYFCVGVVGGMCMLHCHHLWACREDIWRV